jgi:cardiolipin synthase A/B
MPSPLPFAEVRVGSNEIALLRDGLQAYPAMLEAIAAATQSVCLETYIFRDDRTGQRFITALTERAKAGVRVLLMYDAWGSDLTDDSLARLKSAGVDVVAFHPVRWRGGLGRLLGRMVRRNHRKSLVVDGAVGFTGGLNISDDYAAQHEGGAGWRDTHVRIRGLAARQLEALFLETWRRHAPKRSDVSAFKRPTPVPEAALTVVGNDFANQRKDIRRAYVDAIREAKQFLYFTHAYFLPPSRVVREILRAARRGVRVVLIIAGSTDVKLVLWGARALYPRLLRAGVEIYEWQGRVLHAKTAVADGVWATVGSSNLDAQSLRQNLEINAVVRDAGFGAAVERLFLEDLPHCSRVTRETVRGYGLLQRLASWVAWAARRWL